MKQLFLPDHHIQINILNGLRYAPYVRFSELKPKNIESNLFMYHVRQLTKVGLVTKTDQGYGLTEAGKKYMSKSSAENLTYRVQPTVLSVLCIEDPKAKKWLVTERLHQPFLHVTGFPSGKLHEAESFSQAAQRETTEKLGLDHITLKQKGVFEVRYRQNEMVTRHIIGIVSVGTSIFDPDYNFETADFRSFWADQQVLFGGNVFAEHGTLLKLIRQSGNFIESFDA